MDRKFMTRYYLEHYDSYTERVTDKKYYELDAMIAETESFIMNSVERDIGNKIMTAACRQIELADILYRLAYLKGAEDFEMNQKGQI